MPGANWIVLNDVTEMDDNELATHPVAGRIMARAWFWAANVPEHERRIWPPQIRQRPLPDPGVDSWDPWPTSRVTTRGQATATPRGGARRGREPATSGRRPLPSTASSESDIQSGGHRGSPQRRGRLYNPDQPARLKRRNQRANDFQVRLTEQIKQATRDAVEELRRELTNQSGPSVETATRSQLMYVEIEEQTREIWAV